MYLHNVIKKQSLRLAAGAFALLALTSCDWLGIKNPTQDERPQQMVEGPRHAPILNPDTVPPNPEVRGYVHGVQPPQVQPVREGINPEYYNKSPIAAPGANAPMSVNTPPPAAPKKSIAQENADTDPYDYYDESGNPVNPSKEDKQEQGNFFDRIFGSSNDNDDTKRKPLPGNPPYFHEKINGQPSADAARPLNVDELADLPPSAGGDAPAASPEALAENGADSKPSWFGRLFGRYSGNERDPARNVPTPPLSSVPPTPTQFQAVKDQKLQELQDLQGERIGSEQEKKQLDGEPSQQQPMVPADPASGGQSANAPANPAPVLLGHASSDAPAADPAPLLQPSAYTVLPPPVTENKAPPQPDDYVSALQNRQGGDQAPPQQPAQ